MIRVGVVGATGYAGAELVRILLGHPRVELAAVASRSRTGRLDAALPALAGFTELEFVAPDALPDLDAVLLAVPHGAAAPLLPSLRAPRIFDLSRDHRHADGWVYGQVEWNGAQLPDADRIAVPGCFATAIALALAPFAKAGLLAGPARVAAATGSTGSGATPSPTTHHPERFVNLKAYKVLSHQHAPEITTFLRTLGPFPHLHFVPLSAPVDRGILATCFLPLQPGVDAAAVLADAYGDAPGIRLRAGSPELRQVRGTALCDLFATQDGDEAVVLSALDNLGKGAAGQAVQCLNLAFGLPQQLGLRTPALLP